MNKAIYLALYAYETMDKHKPLHQMAMVTRNGQEPPTSVSLRLEYEDHSLLLLTAGNDKQRPVIQTQMTSGLNTNNKTIADVVGETLSSKCNRTGINYNYHGSENGVVIDLIYKDGSELHIWFYNNLCLDIDCTIEIPDNTEKRNDRPVS